MSLEQRVTAIEQIIIQQGVNRLDPTPETDKRLSRLENKVDHLRVDVDGLRTDVDRNSKAIERLEQKVDQLDQKVEKLEQKVDQLEQKVDQLDQKVEKLEQKVDQLDQKVDQLDQKVDQLDQKVDQLDQKVNQLDQKVDRVEQNLRSDMAEGFKQLSNQIATLGSRWGVQNESIWRQTIATVLEKSYGVTVQRLELEGEEFDVLIRNGDHIIIELTARFRSNDINKVIRKRQLYTEKVQAPNRFIVAAAAIHSKHVLQLINFGFEVLEPEMD